MALLRGLLLPRLSGEGEHGPLGGANIFYARSPQQLRSVPLHGPVAGILLNGRKEFQVGTTMRTVHPGQLVFWPATGDLYCANYPDGPSRIYLALFFGFSPQAIEHFGRHYGSQTRAWELPPVWSAQTPPAVMRAIIQWVQLCLEGPVDPEILHHRQVELLLLLARHGLGSHLLMARQPGWRQRVAHLLSLDPSRAWEAGEVSERVGCAASSLRRHLRDEGTGFRELLEEVRLVAGLALLQETFWPVVRVAAEVGYDSPSRFSERFRLRFGVTPSELKRTRVSDCGEQMSVAGEVAAGE